MGLVVRPVKPQPVYIDFTAPGWTGASIHQKPDDEPIVFTCPLGVSGDRLRCRETWDFIPWTFESVMILYGVDAISRELPSPKGWHPTLYGYQRWRSPATMPAWASRITLEVVGVRCVRVQEITEGDIYNIGAEWNLKHAHTDGIDVLGGFIRWWNQYYVKRGLSWGSNPFVWAVEVRRVEG